MKKTILLLFFFGYFSTNAQSKNRDLQIFTFPEVEKLQQLNPKPVLVFIYTDWCKICHGMKKKTFKNEGIISVLNDHFYFVNLNAEDKNNITFLEKTFVYKPSGTASGMHELAKELGSIEGKIRYPTTTILNSDFEIDIQLSEYVNSNKMSTVLKKYLKLNH
jgi:thioredoxin-related protein